MSEMVDIVVYPVMSVVMELEEPEDLSITLDNVVVGGSGPNQWSDIFGKPFETVDQETLRVDNGVLKVRTTDAAEVDNFQPITSAGVQTIVGNIEILLELV